MIIAYYLYRTQDLTNLGRPKCEPNRPEPIVFTSSIEGGSRVSDQFESPTLSPQNPLRLFFSSILSWDSSRSDLIWSQVLCTNYGSLLLVFLLSYLFYVVFVHLIGSSPRVLRLSFGWKLVFLSLFLWFIWFRLFSLMDLKEKGFSFVSYYPKLRVSDLLFKHLSIGKDRSLVWPKVELRCWWLWYRFAQRSHKEGRLLLIVLLIGIRVSM